MSTGERHTYREAADAANRFKRLFDGLYLKWAIAGSLRRHKPDVGDIEHVVMPNYGLRRPIGTMLQENVDLVRHKLDEMLGSTVTKAVYSDGKTRWGDKYRGVMHDGHRHEVFIADDRNWGAMLAIRTGPADLSKRLVTQIRNQGYMMREGYVRYARGKAEGHVIACPTEERFFQMCAEPWCDPENR